MDGEGREISSGGSSAHPSGGKGGRTAPLLIGHQLGTSHPASPPPWCLGYELPPAVTALEDWSLQCPSHRGRAGQEMWWRLGDSAVLTAPRSLAAGDSSMSPLCLLHLPVPPAWVVILTESVLTPKREEDGAIKCWSGRRESCVGSTVGICG